MKQKKKMTSTGFLLLITIVLFFVMYAAGMVIFADKGFAKPQMFLNLFVSNAGLLVISCGLTIVMITGGIDISVDRTLSTFRKLHLTLRNSLSKSKNSSRRNLPL